VTGADQFGETEIEELHVAALVDHDVRRLQVAMDDSRGMGGSEGVGDGDAVPECLVDPQPPSMHQAIERLAVDVLHDEEVEVPLAADVVNRADVRVIQRGDEAGSRVKRSRAGGVQAPAPAITLIATVRPSRVSRAR